MSIDRISQLKALHLYGMASAWGEYQAEVHPRPVLLEVCLDRLIMVEQAARQARSLRYQSRTISHPSGSRRLCAG
jgi:hypothetical protein